MDEETKLLLNLSPIPEVSEVELSTMFEQLSGLSDLNSDITDRNVEDILKEAEELIDNSSSSKFEEFKVENDVLPESRLSLSQRVDIKQSKVDECVTKNEETSIQRDSTSSEQDMLKTSENLESLSPSKKNELKLQYLPKKQTFLPGNSINHIKSTIDSLKEFSCAIEKQFSERQTSPSSSSSRETNNRLNICRDKEKEITVDLLARTDNGVTKSCSKTNLDMPRSFKSKDKGEETLGIDKSLKILNCFERLYKDRPLRLSGNVKKPIKNEKISRLGTKKKVQSFKPSGNLCNKNNKNLERAHEVKKKPLAKNTERCAEIENQSDTSCSKELQADLTSDKQNEPEKSDFNFTSQMSLDNYCKYKALSKEVFCTLNENHSPYVFNPHKTEEKLLWRLLEDMTEIKNQIKQTGWSQLSDRACTGDGGSLSNCHPPSEDDAASGKISSEEISKVGICRLEEQFFTLQSKYDEQIKKLEMQNFKLMEELKIRQKEFEKDDVGIKQDTFQFDKLKHLVDLPDSRGVTPPSNTEKEIDQTVLLGNNKASGRPQADNKIEQRNQFPVVLKEAFSQTETKHQNAGVQCAQYTCNCSLKETTVDLKKITSEHELQLMATLRGLQAEIALRDKENRKLKTEMNGLRSQLNRLNKKKLDVTKKSHFGSQTIALGPVVQRPYDSRAFELGQSEFEKENNELKARLKALEDSFELLKQKRISDLQALHKVHEKEMSKLVTELQVEVALSKSLYAVLKNDSREANLFELWQKFR